MRLYEHLTGTHYIDGVSARSPAELRSMRAECEQMEAAISYVRRALHGRLDIVHAEERRRAHGDADAGLADLVASLPSILAETQPVGVGGSLRIKVAVDQVGVQEELMAAVDAVAGPEALTHLPNLSDGELQSTAEGLAALEHEFSVARRQLHHQIDAVQAQLTSRYESGELSVDALLA